MALNWLKLGDIKVKLSTKGRYGLKAMLDLAVYGSNKYISIKSIAERQNISENYLEQLFAVLKRVKLVKSARGAQGGYTLSKKPQEITVGSILRALEGPLSPVDCVTDGTNADCARYEECVTRMVWKKIKDCINEVVDSVTLKDLADEYDKIKNKNYIYYI